MKLTRIIFTFSLLLGAMFLSMETQAQTTTQCEGSFTNTAISTSCVAANRTVIGDGTVGYIKICIDVNNLGTDKCSGVDESLRFYDNAGNLTLLVRSTGVTIYGGRATLTGGCYVMNTTGPISACHTCLSGSYEVSYGTVDGSGNNVCVPCVDDSECPAGMICDSGDCVDTPCTDDSDCPSGYECGGGGTCVKACDYSGETVNSNNTLTSSSNVNECGTAFATCNYGATPGGCVGERAMGTDLYNDLDCNTETVMDGRSNGADVGFSIENDIYYVICADEIGEWELEITGSNCVSAAGGATASGYQVAIFEGDPDGTSLNTLLAGGEQGQNLTGTHTFTFATSDPEQCIFLMIDGYAGVQCEFDVTITPTEGQECTFYEPPFLPITLLSFEGVKKRDHNLITWETATEQDNNYFIVEKSIDGGTWEEVGKVKGAGNSLQKIAYSLKDESVDNEINYYRLTQYDFDGDNETFHIISIDNRTNIKLIKTINTLGQEVDGDYKGIVIEYYDDGSTIKRYQNE